MSVDEIALKLNVDRDTAYAFIRFLVLAKAAYVKGKRHLEGGRGMENVYAFTDEAVEVLQQVVADFQQHIA